MANRGNPKILAMGISTGKGVGFCSSYFQVARLFPRMNTSGAKTVRLESVDLLRGIVMILMALDHVRDFMGTGISPTDLTQTTVSLFFARWITDICAPVFFLLTGTGAYLLLRRFSRRELSHFLFLRGLWLIFLEVFVLRCFGLQFNFDYQLTMLVVIWALGWAMILLSALVYLPDAVIAGAFVVIALYPLCAWFARLKQRSSSAWLSYL
jgi:uncharacterized membrane protein